MARKTIFKKVGAAWKEAKKQVEAEMKRSGLDKRLERARKSASGLGDFGKNTSSGQKYRDKVAGRIRRNRKAYRKVSGKRLGKKGVRRSLSAERSAKRVAVLGGVAGGIYALRKRNQKKRNSIKGRIRRVRRDIKRRRDRLGRFV